MDTVRKPKRAPAKRLEGAPPYILAVHDMGPKFNDRYTVVFGWPLWQADMGRRVPYLGLSEGGVGVSMWGELSDSSDRVGCGKLISWKDLSEATRKHIVARANYPDPIKIGTLERISGHIEVVKIKTGADGRNRTKVTWPTQWTFGAEDGIGYFGPAFETAKLAREYAEKNCIIIIKGTE